MDLCTRPCIWPLGLEEQNRNCYRFPRSLFERVWGGMRAWRVRGNNLEFIEGLGVWGL